LKNENKKWDNSISAYAYLENCMELIEQEYANTSERIFMPSFKYFQFVSEYSFYYRRTTNQVILIHKNGAYAMYNKKENANETIKDIFFYYEETTCRIHMHNSSGQNVWVDFEKAEKTKLKRIQKTKEKKLAAA
jgi:tmRNA-binding protein